MSIIERGDFKAADIAEHRARKLAWIDARRELERTLTAAENDYLAACEPTCEADVLEARERINEALDMAALAIKIEAKFAALAARDVADRPNPTDRAILAETLADRFSDDHLARVFLAAFALEGN